MAIIRIINVHGTFDAQPERNPEGRLKWWQGERQFSGQPVEMPDRMEVPTSPFVAEIAKKFGADEGRAIAECFRWSGSYKEEKRREAGVNLARALEAAIAAEDDTYFILVGHSHGGSVIRYALQYINIPSSQHDRILSWNTVGTPFLHFRRPFDLFNLSLAKTVALIAGLSFLVYVLGAFTDVRCRLQEVDENMIKVPPRLCRMAEGIAPLATASQHSVTADAEEVVVSDLQNPSAEMLAPPPAVGEGEGAEEDAPMAAEPEAYRMDDRDAEALKYVEPDSAGGFFDFGQNDAPPSDEAETAAYVEAQKATINQSFREFRNGLLVLTGFVGLLMTVLVISGRKINQDLYSYFRNRRFKNVFGPKWNGFLAERDEAVVGLGLGADQFADNTKIIPPGALRPVLFMVVLVIIFMLVGSWEIAQAEGEGGNPISAIIAGLQDLLKVKEKDQGFFSQWLESAGMSKDVAALFDVPVEFGIGAFILVAVSSLFVSFPWTNYVRSFGDGRIVRIIRAVLLGTDDIEGESVFAVRFYPKYGNSAQATVLPDEVAEAQTDRVNGAAPQTLEFIRKEIGLYGINLGGDALDLSEKVGQHFTWDELYHTTYFTVPEVREYLIEEIASRTPGTRNS